MAEAPFKHLTVIGTGLIGGSVVMAARERYPELWIQAVDTSSETLQYLLKAGTVDKVSLTVPGMFAENHLVVLACHLSASLETLENLAPVVSDIADVTITDVGSCKRQMVALGERLLPERYIAAHPMAGKEFSGVRHATALLFAGKSWIFCPHKRVDTARFDRLKTFIQGFGAVPRVLDPEVHDRYMAYVSHLPQLYSVLLTNLIARHEPGHLLSYHGGGIDDQLRLAASPYAMWGEVFRYNADNLRDVLHELTSLMGQADPVLDQPAFAEWFERSNELHHEFHNFRM